MHVGIIFVARTAAMIQQGQCAIRCSLNHALKHGLIFLEYSRNAFWHKGLKAIVEIGHGIQAELCLDLSQACDFEGLTRCQLVEFLRWEEILEDGDFVECSDVHDCSLDAF